MVEQHAKHAGCSASLKPTDKLASNCTVGLIFPFFLLSFCVVVSPLPFPTLLHGAPVFN